MPCFISGWKPRGEPFPSHVYGVNGGLAQNGSRAKSICIENNLLACFETSKEDANVISDI